MRKMSSVLRKILCLGVVASMALGLAACGTTGTPTDVTTAPATSTEPTATNAAVGVLGENSFESDTDLAGWAGRSEGSVTIERSDKAAHTGTYSLFTDKRTIDWNGPGCTYPFEAGKTYTISGWAYQESGKKQMIILSAETTVGGVAGYQNLQRMEIESGVWTELTGTFRAGDNVEKTVIYFETLDAPGLSFYIDDLNVIDKDSASLNGDLPSLAETYKDSFPIGVAIPLSAFSDTALMDFVSKQYTTYTNENELKPESILDLDACRAAAEGGDETHPVLTFEKALPLLDYAKENGFTVHGHTLVWLKQTPMEFFHESYDLEKPVVSKEIMLQRLENYIAAVFAFVTENYPGVITTWDVVNETIDGATGSMRPTKTQDSAEGDMWYEVVGADYVEYAFTYARQYAPADVQLFYNDFNVPYEPKQTGIYNIIKGLYEKGLIDGIGFQAHYEVENPSIDQISKAIDRFSALGLRVRISELDIQAPSNSEEDMLKQANRYAELMAMFVEKKDKIDAVVFWGISDGTSWMAEKFPLLFDADMQPKYSFWALTDPTMLPPTVKKANAYGASEVSDENFALATPYTFDKNSFRALYVDGKLTVRVYVYDISDETEDSVTVFLPDGPVTVNRDQGIKTEDGYYVDVVCPVTLEKGASLDFDVLAMNLDKPSAWNDPQNADAVRNLGAITFVELASAATAVKGTPDMTTDEPDALWDAAPVFLVDKSASETADEDGAVSVSYRAMWDEENLYLLVNAIDPFLDDSSSTSYEQDSVEIFLDAGNDKVGTYEAGDGQFRINFKNVMTIDHGASVPESRTFITDDGFWIEIKIPLETAVSQGDVFGFDVRYNNIDKNAKRNLLNFWDTTDTGWKDTAVFALLVLE